MAIKVPSGTISLAWIIRRVEMIGRPPMPTMLGILHNTPWWVFALFGTLTVLGIQGLRPRTLPIWRVMITPLLFLGWGVESLIVQSLSAPILLADWLITCAAAAAL